MTRLDDIAHPFQRYEDHDTGAPMYLAEEVDPKINELVAEVRSLQQQLAEGLQVFRVVQKQRDELQDELAEAQQQIAVLMAGANA